MNCKKILMHFPFIYSILLSIKKIPTLDVFCKRMSIKSLGGGLIKIHKFIKGYNNQLEIGNNVYLIGTKIHVVGNNNRIVFKDNVKVGENCSFWMEGNNISIIIGENTTFTHTVHFCAQEDNTSIVVGDDCMFANTIVVRTSDSHPIYDLNTNVRINPAKNVVIGNHVWIAPGSKILKGAQIENNSIVGSNSIVTGIIPSNCLAVGAPCRIVKENVGWTREKIF